MSIWQALGLGTLQGIAEFLPISSSGHLTLFQIIYGLQDTPLTLSILLHLGTLLAVFVVYWRRILDMIMHPIQSELKYLILATIPAVIAALTMKDFIETAFAGSYLGICFLLTCAILLISEAVSRLRVRHHKAVTWKDSLVMGCMQAVAILPGLSRSGSTIAGGLFSGLNRKQAADFSFLMSIPAILGSAVMDLKDIYDGAKAANLSLGAHMGSLIADMGGALPVLVSVITAAIFGFLAIKFMLYLIKRISLNWFALYTGVLGAIVLVWQLLN